MIETSKIKILGVMLNSLVSSFSEKITGKIFGNQTEASLDAGLDGQRHLGPLVIRSPVTQV